MDSSAAIRALAGLRLAVGAGAWLAPRATGKAFMLAPDDNPQSPYLARLFGARDAALAYGVLDSSGDAQRRWLVAGLAATSPTRSPRSPGAARATSPPCRRCCSPRRR